MERMLIIPVKTSYDTEGKSIEYVAKVTAPSGNTAAGIGETALEALRNLVNAEGPITSKALEDYINAKLGI